MNKYIKEQLDKVSHVKLPPYDDKTTHLSILRTTAATVNTQADAERAIHALSEHLEKPQPCELLIGHCYKIDIDQSLVYNEDAITPWYKTIHNSWNNGTGPSDSLMMVQVMEFNISKRMVRMRGKGIMNNELWAGWLPVTNFKILEEISL